MLPKHDAECEEMSPKHDAALIYRLLAAWYCVNEGRLTRNVHKLKSNRERIAETIRNLERYVTYHTFHRLTGYKLPKKRVKNTGRLFAYPSVQSLPSSVRNQVLDERYMDFDIDACHPTCLIALFRARGFKPPGVLIDYVEKKSEWRKTLAAYYETTAGNVKERINAAMNSQESPKNWFIDKCIPIKEDHPFITEFCAMIKMVTETLVSDEMVAFARDILKARRPRVTALFEHLCIIERCIVDLLEDELINTYGCIRRYILNMLDGKLAICDRPADDAMMNALHRVVAQKLDIWVKFSCKTNGVSATTTDPLKLTDKLFYKSVRVDIDGKRVDIDGRCRRRHAYLCQPDHQFQCSYISTMAR